MTSIVLKPMSHYSKRKVSLFPLSVQTEMPLEITNGCSLLYEPRAPSLGISTNEPLLFHRKENSSTANPHNGSHHPSQERSNCPSSGTRRRGRLPQRAHLLPAGWEDSLYNLLRALQLCRKSLQEGTSMHPVLKTVGLGALVLLQAPP